MRQQLLHHDEGVDVMPANLQLADLEAGLVNVRGREGVMKKYLSEIKDDYDYILIDCLSNLGMSRRSSEKTTMIIYVFIWEYQSLRESRKAKG